MTTAAFASISFFNGLAGAIGYFSFASMTRNAMASLIMILSILAIVSYLLSAHIHSSNKAYIAAHTEREK